MKLHFRVSHNKWAIPVLVQLKWNHGSKFVTLVNSLSVSRDALTRTLQALIKSELVQRNQGYGHPLRPEYILTKKGYMTAERFEKLYHTLKTKNLFEVVIGNKWAIPVIQCLTCERGFNEVKNVIKVSPRALTLTLKELKTAGLIERRLEDGYPPKVKYTLTKMGNSLFSQCG